MSLQLVHPQADLAPVFAALGVRADPLHRAGEPRKDSAGALQRGRYRFSAGSALLSSCAADGRASEPLDCCIARWAATLAAHRQLLREHLAGGGRAELSVRIGSAAPAAFNLPAAVLASIASLGMGLALRFGADASARACMDP